MKVRHDFVTNSSSSSFIISKKILTKKQIEAIRNHSELGEKLNIRYAKSDAWNIEENNEYITGYTWMDNFSMYDFLKAIDINLKKVCWREYPFNINEYNNQELEENNININNSCENLLDEILNNN